MEEKKDSGEAKKIKFFEGFIKFFCPECKRPIELSDKKWNNSTLTSFTCRDCGRVTLLTIQLSPTDRDVKVVKK